MDELLEGVIHSQRGELEKRKAEFVDLQVRKACFFGGAGMYVESVRARSRCALGSVCKLVSGPTMYL